MGLGLANLSRIRRTLSKVLLLHLLPDHALLLRGRGRGMVRVRVRVRGRVRVRV